MKNGTEAETKKQLNVRVPASLRIKFDKEIARQGRKRDIAAERIVRWFLGLKSAEREEICSQAA